MDESTVLGPDGQPFRKEELLEEVAAPSTTGVRSILSDHPAQGLTPVRLARLLRSAEEGDAKAYLELAEEMEEKDHHYAGVLGVRKRAVRSMEIHVEAGDETTAAEEAAALVRDVLCGDGVCDDLVDILDAIGKGYSLTEIIWRTEASLWTVERLEWRDPRWFRLDREDGRTPLLIDEAGELPLTPYKFITHFARVKSGIPIRGGLARLASWGYLFKNYGLRDWAIFAETYGHPIRLGRYGPSATPDDVKKLLAALRNVGRDRAGAIPRSMEIEIIQAAMTGSSSDMYERLCRFWDEQTSKGVLGQVGTTDAIAGGHAVGKVHNDVRGDISESDADQLAVTLRRDLATPLTRFNFGNDVPVPSVRLAAADEVDVRVLTAAVRQLVPLGLRVSEATIRSRLHLPEPDDGDILLAAPQRPGFGEGALPITARAEHGHRHHDTSLDDLVDHIIDEGHGAAAAAPLMQRLARDLQDSPDLEVLRRRLADLADTAPPEDLVALLSGSVFAGEMAGLLDVDIHDRAP